MTTLPIYNTPIYIDAKNNAYKLHRMTMSPGPDYKLYTLATEHARTHARSQFILKPSGIDSFIIQSASEKNMYLSIFINQSDNTYYLQFQNHPGDTHAVRLQYETIRIQGANETAIRTLNKYPTTTDGKNITDKHLYLTIGQTIDNFRFPIILVPHYNQVLSYFKIKNLFDKTGGARHENLFECSSCGHRFREEND